MSRSGSWDPRDLRTSSLSRSSTSRIELPNLPGVRRDLINYNPTLYKKYKASISTEQLEPLVDLTAPLAEEFSLMSYFENPDNFNLIQRLSPFPRSGSAYNDEAGRYSLKSQLRDRELKTRSLPYSSLASVPTFVTNTSRTTRFLAYFSERTMEKGVEITKSRKVEIILYLDDNTIEITEPKVENCGIVQGRILKRHQVPRSGQRGEWSPSQIITLDDFYSGSQLQIYNRIYYIVDCDNVTRKYLEDMGTPFGNPVPLPDNLYMPIGSRPIATRSESRGTRADSPSKRGAGIDSYHILPIFAAISLLAITQLLHNKHYMYQIHCSIHRFLPVWHTGFKIFWDMGRHRCTIWR